jgi:hypothetical protein
MIGKRAPASARAGWIELHSKFIFGTIATICRRDVMAIQARQARYAEANPGTILPARRAKRPALDRRGHEDWKQRIEGEWQSHLQTLHECVRAILSSNQRPGAELTTAMKPERGYGNAINL